MKTVWDSTVEAFNTAKTAVVDGSTKIVTKIKEATQFDEQQDFNQFFKQVQDLKREAKNAANKIQVIRINILNVSSTYLDIVQNISNVLDNERSKQLLQKAQKYCDDLKKLSDVYLPLYAEQPYDDFLKSIKQSMPLFKEVSDLIDKVGLQKTLLKAQAAMPDKAVDEIKQSINNNIIKLQEKYVELNNKIDEFNTTYSIAKKKSFAALVFYYDQFIKISALNGFAEETNNPTNVN